MKQGMDYVGSCIRPPSEANSILLQVTLGCSHGKCTFCGSYPDKKFGVKDEATILSDIKFAGRYMQRQERLFLMDGDALILPQRKLNRILDQINEHLPWIKRIGTYANAKGIRKKSLEELMELRRKKLHIVYLGVESGDERVLEDIRKGSSADELADLGQKIKKSGIKLSVTVLLGIAGRERSLEHARATGALLTRMDPDYVGALTVMLIPGTPLAEQEARGAFQLPEQEGLLLELREMLASTNLSSGLFISNHASNYLPIKVRMPRHKQEGLQQIDQALSGSLSLKPEWMRAL